MNSNSFSRVELFFWNFAIRALSQSDFARSCIKEAYKLTHETKTGSLGILLGISGFAGLLSGYLFYFLRMGLR